MKNIGVALALSVIVGGAPLVAAHAQDATAAGPSSPSSFPDVPANHWAYQAVSDLAAKGYVKGYPDGTFKGQRALTRYEFATVIARMLSTLNDIAAKAAAAQQTPPQTPTGTYATQDDLNKLQALVDEFRKELDAVKANTAGFQDQLDALRQDILDTKDLVARAQDTANSSYGFGSTRKFKITGYVQARYQSARSGNKSAYPEGLGAVTGATGSFNGNYAVGGTADTFVARRARLKATGGVTPNTSYAIQIDAGGFTTNSTSPNNVTVREANVAYTFGEGDKTKSPTLTAGLFANFFGYELPTSSSDILSPERPLAFNEGGSGLFINQDYDRGASLNVPLRGTGLVATVAGVNGTGLNGITGGGVSNGATVGGGGNDNNNYIDQIYRLAYTPSGSLSSLGLGASAYEGRIARPGVTTINGTVVGYTGANYQEAKKELYGFDAHYTAPFGLFLAGEYIAGKYELRSYFTGQSSFKSNQYAPGNKVEGYYGEAAYSLFATSAHPLTLAVVYDVFKRSKSGVDSNALDGAGASGSSFDDENIGYGVLYSLDKQTRLRFWYEQPNKVAHAANVAEPKKIGLFTTELQVKF